MAMPSLRWPRPVLGCLLVAFGCSPDDPAPLLVHAAASLGETVTAIATEWERQPGNPTVSASFAATSQIARQIQHGAPGDVFFAADEAWMDVLADGGHIRAETRVALLANRIVVVTPANAAFVPTDLGGLVDPRVGRIGLAAELVPAGRYADEVLHQVGLAAVLAAKTVRGDNVRTVLAWVARKEIDAGIVYATDALAEPAVRIAFPIPDPLQPNIVYPIAVLTETRRPKLAQAFLSFCRGPQARAIFERAGFVVLDGSP